MKDAKQVNEIRRLIAAFGYSWCGLKAAIAQPAFRTELAVVSIGVPLALLLPLPAYARAMMISSLLLVLIVELLNTGIEAAIDRISTEWHPLSKLAKDVGSAAVLLSIINAGVIWLILLF